MYINGARQDEKTTFMIQLEKPDLTNIGYSESDINREIDLLNASDLFDTIICRDDLPRRYFPHIDDLSAAAQKVILISQSQLSIQGK